MLKNEIVVIRSGIKSEMADYPLQTLLSKAPANLRQQMHGW